MKELQNTCCSYLKNRRIFKPENRNRDIFTYWQAWFCYCWVNIISSYYKRDVIYKTRKITYNNKKKKIYLRNLYQCPTRTVTSLYSMVVVYNIPLIIIILQMCHESTYDHIILIILNFYCILIYVCYFVGYPHCALQRRAHTMPIALVAHYTNLKI